MILLPSLLMMVMPVADFRTPFSPSGLQKQCKGAEGENWCRLPRISPLALPKTAFTLSGRVACWRCDSAAGWALVECREILDVCGRWKLCVGKNGTEGAEGWLYFCEFKDLSLDSVQLRECMEIKNNKYI